MLNYYILLFFILTFQNIIVAQTQGHAFSLTHYLNSCEFILTKGPTLIKSNDRFLIINVNNNSFEFKEYKNFDEELMNSSNPNQLIEYSNFQKPLFEASIEFDKYNELHFDFRLKDLSHNHLESKSTERSHFLRGKELFQFAIKYYEKQAKAINAYWASGDNLNEFLYNISQGDTEEVAALNTWTGRNAQKANFDTILLLNQKHTRIKLLYVKVKFGKSKTHE